MRKTGKDQIAEEEVYHGEHRRNMFAADTA